MILSSHFFCSFLRRKILQQVLGDPPNVAIFILKGLQQFWGNAPCRRPEPLELEKGTRLDSRLLFLVPFS
jgi:hypothetical protein